MDSTAHWIWYPGDFSIHQGMLQNFAREERGMGWPAYWYIDDCNRNINFSRTYDLDNPTDFTVYARGIGYVDINGKKFRLGETLRCESGKNVITIFVGNPTGLPCVYIDGLVVKSDKGWQASNFVSELPAGNDPLFTSKDQNPNVIEYQKAELNPTKVKEIDNGVLFDFGRAVNGSLKVKLHQIDEVTICYGESRTEALDVDMCYYKQESVDETTHIRKRAFRFVFIPNAKKDNINLIAIHEYIPKQNISDFQTDNPLINKIWNVSTETLNLCSDLFFIDGIKRDRWIWAGDAYQANFINQYSFFNEEVDRRTLLALRGQDNIKQHINTIVDYSMLWVIGVLNHYEMTGDREFLKIVYPKMESMVRYFINQTNKQGFIYGRENDWIFVDWSEIDKDGTVAAEQALLIEVYKTMVTCGSVLNRPIEYYQTLHDQLLENFLQHFWNEKKGAFIDSYESGKNHVTRHANIFAILFDLVDDDKKESILKNVLLNDKITRITTPYFKFFEQDALCKMNRQDIVYTTILDYWGGMLANDAVTFWEEYDPTKSGKDMYSMYGDPYGKSLCHAWGASPIYLLGRYFVGLYPTRPGYREFHVEPELDQFNKFHAILPIKNGKVIVDKNGDTLSVLASKGGGTLVLGKNEYALIPNKKLTVSLNHAKVDAG
ncbi:alpha-L-rhamnosidase-related protein [Lentilactobacillus buchneri]|uniref:alpha-L-rhamnosidase-related protein n=1 Tax=Lentilactobacillus buchneri TaxID=1581 RepID=UPI0010AC27C6|nr:amylo-alpha-1,6-glucosidase [Lentilactobacillus buchneri]MCC6100680.1 family 78 glycoside hydrolase catalytic domain [Lactobacillus sp.]MCT2900625.1 alpha-rhamnosidase [Lentilactobacillus buchneri]MCT3542608.1 alpha-rhamnosidase [Lentilactobacillus buchneri]MCT3545675.1 alpha-rhamnosidase [Lentilactobacillus buchneri]MCT3552643.1 alpha-rhamnosidase [Lentilactobacillus buchneri]